MVAAYTIISVITMKNKLKEISTLLMMVLFSSAAFSDVDEGKEAFSAGNYDKAANEFRISAEKGNSEAQLLFGVMYTLDLWQKNDKEAAKWIKKAAEQGESEAQYMLAMLYGRGTGIQQNSLDAGKWYKAAAEQGHTKSQTMLGRWYAVGIGVSQSYDKSAFWFKKAAEQGDLEAQYELGVNYASFKKYSEASDWFLRAAKQGHINAMLQLGLLYEEGKGVSQDSEIANTLFQEVTSNEQVKGEAFFQLGTKYLIDDFGVPQDYVVSTKWFRKAAELGHTSSQFILASSYLDGHGVRQNKSEAKKWFGKNCDGGDQRGCEQYRKLNEQGIN